MATSISKDHPDYQNLLEIWLAEGQPDNFMVGTRTYNAVKPSDDQVTFILQGGFDDTYGSRSPIPGSG